MKLHKYVRDATSVCKMAEGSIKFARIDDLNDPMELVPIMNEDAVRSSLQLLRKHGFTDEQLRWLKCQDVLLTRLAPEYRVLSAPSVAQDANRILRSPAYDDFGYMGRQLRGTIALIRSKVGVLSLTARFDSLPMWAHYADNARGYVVEFDGLDAVFGTDASGSLNCLTQMRYSAEALGMTFDPASQNNLFFVKFEDWAYEREWRVVSCLEDCAEVAPGLFVRQIPRAHVTGVRCGWNVPEAEVRSLREELARINPGLRFRRCRLDSGKISFYEEAA